MTAGKKHEWASLWTYLREHERVLNTFATYMDRPRVYIQKTITPNYLELECENIILTTYIGTKVRVDISKDVEIDDSIPRRPKAKTILYSYNANFPKGGNILRYDSPDPPAQLGPHSPAHHHFHHKHVWTGGKEQILRIGDEDWPHVEEFLREILENY